MSDLISRQAVIDTIETDCSWDIFNEWGSRTPTGECIINAIKSVPSVEPEKCGDCVNRQAVLEIQAKYAEHIGATKFWQMRDDIRALPSVEPERKFIEKVFETLREMDDAADVICNLDVDAVLDRMEVASNE